MIKYSTDYKINTSHLILGTKSTPIIEAIFHTIFFSLNFYFWVGPGKDPRSTEYKASTVGSRSLLINILMNLVNKVERSK